MNNVEWIPCKKNLPEKSDRYLVTIKWAESESEVCVLRWNAYEHLWNDDGDLWGGIAIAWTECPKPYKADEDDQID